MCKAIIGKYTRCDHAMWWFEYCELAESIKSELHDNSHIRYAVQFCLQDSIPRLGKEPVMIKMANSAMACRNWGYWSRLPMIMEVPCPGSCDSARIGDCRGSDFKYKFRKGKDYLGTKGETDIMEWSVHRGKSHFDGEYAIASKDGGQRWTRTRQDDISHKRYGRLLKESNCPVMKCEVDPSGVFGPRTPADGAPAGKTNTDRNTKDYSIPQQAPPQSTSPRSGVKIVKSRNRGSSYSGEYQPNKYNTSSSTHPTYNASYATSQSRPEIANVNPWPRTRQPTETEYRSYNEEKQPSHRSRTHRQHVSRAETNIVDAPKSARRTTSSRRRDSRAPQGDYLTDEEPRYEY